MMTELEQSTDKYTFLIIDWFSSFKFMMLLFTIKKTPEYSEGYYLIKIGAQPVVQVNRSALSSDQRIT